jgi:hypothetical protein
MSLLQILTDPQNFRFYAGGRGHVSTTNAFGQTSIPYGSDMKGGGSSNQPYIKSPIPEALTPQNPDFLLRGGLLNNPQTSAQDVSRLTQLFTDTKSTNGLFFTLKQQQLSATAVRTQASPVFGLNGQLYSPLNTLAQAGLVSQGTHLNKQGINPFAETGAYANGNESLYGVVVTNRQDPELNRLVQLVNGKLNPNNKAQGPDPAYIMKYNGGPGSIRGLGQTLIRFGRDSKTFLSDEVTNPIPSAYSQNTFTFNSFLLGNVSTNTSEGGVSIPSNLGILSPLEFEAFINQSQQQSNLPLDLTPVSNKNQIASPKYQDFRKILRSKLKETDAQIATDSGATPNTPDYQSKNYEQNFNFTDPGQRTPKSYANYSKGVIGSNGKTVEAVDKINASLIYRSEPKEAGKFDTYNDFVKFTIASIDNNNPAFNMFMHFRALLDSFNDNYSAKWGNVRYLGRGENFYNYNGFTREINLSFTTAAQSKQELIPMYKKLNYLASQLMPDYSNQGYMRGSLVKLTVGGYLDAQPGFITNLNYDLITDAPWEIAINETGDPDPTVKQLSQMVKVTGFTFVPIHTFVPQKQGLGFAGQARGDASAASSGNVTSYGPQRFIALSSPGQPSNYDPLPQ